MTSSHELVISGLTAEVAGRQILHGVDLVVRSGEVHAIMGPNGSGKSTLSHVLTGRPGYTVTGGSITLDGTELVGLAPHERAQAGRYRQHHQVGLEVLGSADPDVDVEIISLGWEFLAALGLRQVDLLLNTMGTTADRLRYVEVLRAWLTDHLDDLAPDDRDRVAVHPMRVLDSKRPATQAVTAEAPAIADHLSPESEAHFARVQEGLAARGIPFTVSPRLVRGFDYYTHTTFELVPSLVENAQATILGGGRFDGLVEELGGRPTPGIGFGSGIERLLIACDAEGVFPGPGRRIDVFVVDVTGGHHARDITAELRAAGIRCDRA